MEYIRKSYTFLVKWSGSLLRSYTYVITNYEFEQASETAEAKRIYKYWLFRSSQLEKLTFLLFLQGFHNWTLNPFHMVVFGGILGAGLLSAIHGSTYAEHIHTNIMDFSPRVVGHKVAVYLKYQ